jgi:hypothetical protein
MTQLLVVFGLLTNPKVFSLFPFNKKTKGRITSLSAATLGITGVVSPQILPFQQSCFSLLIIIWCVVKLLAAAEPARDTTLCLGRTVLHLAVKLVDGFEGFAFGVLGVCLGLLLELGSFPIGFGPL